MHITEKHQKQVSNKIEKKLNYIKNVTGSQHYSIFEKLNFNYLQRQKKSQTL